MNLRKVYRLATVLTLSQLRSTRGRGMAQTSLFRRPAFLVAVDAVLFGLTSLAGFGFSSVVSAESGPATLSAIARQAVAGLPLSVLSFCVFIGVLWEVNISPSFASTDQVNWLPITASEYVVASMASLASVYSPILATLLGPTLGLATTARLPIMWVAVVPFGLLALLAGALAIEILRAATNRLSTVLSRRSGRATMALRMMVLVFALAGYQLLFNSGVLGFLVASVGAGSGRMTFIPLVWPTFALRSFLDGEVVVGALFSLLSALFLFLLLVAAVELRRRYWVPTPLTVKLRGAKVSLRKGILGRVGLNAAEAAIVRKDIRAITRRREMAGILGIPVALTVSVFAANLSSPASAVPAFTYLWVLSLIYGIGFFVFLHSMMSVGQEGFAVWNLYASPLTPREFVRAKAGTTLILSLPAASLAWLVATLLLHLSYRGSLAILISLSGLAGVGTFLGLAMAIRFPDFSEAGRNRFVQVPGAILGAVFGLICFAAVLAPFVLYLFLFAAGPARDVSFSILSGISISLSLGITAILRYTCLRSAWSLLYALPV